VHELGPERPKRKRRIDWLGIDARLDSGIASAWETTKDRYNAASSYFARFRLSGPKRFATNLMSEGLTLTAGALVFLYALAIPALIDFDESKINSVNYSVKFLDRAGNEIGKRGIYIDDAVPLEEIPDHLIKATLATEDRRFYEHYGVDVIGTLRALVTNVNAGETVQGGSTLTQQLAKNLFLSSERTFIRKLKEAYIAFLLEARLSKRDILKLYLDRAYMGGGAFGVEAAAQFYFGKSVRHVTLAEAAVMAGLFKAPTKFAPHTNPANARARANVVLANLVDAGFMTAGQVEQARRNPARAIETRSTTSPDWFLDWAFEEVQRLADGKGHYVLTARTTIDLDLQRAADEALQSTIRQHGRSHNARAGALVSMETDGAVRALVGGTDYGESQFNRATHARRQPGSSFKIYVYAAALEAGMSNRSVVRDNAPAPCGPLAWQPKNYDGSSGRGYALTMQEAFKQSLNTVATELALYRVGRDKVIDMTRRLGIDGIKRSCSMALGDTGITPLEHTGAVATIANNGVLATPYGILEITNSRGETIYSHEKDAPPRPQVLSPRVVAEMNQMMSAVVTEGTGRRAALDITHVVGKTGTSSSYRDAWFVGYTAQYVTTVWIGNDDFRPMMILPSARTGNAIGVTGGSLPAQTWQAYMTIAHANPNIPTLAGLSPHPRLVQEQQRLAELRRSQPANSVSVAGASAPGRRSSLLPEQSREALRRVVESMRRATGGVPPAPANAAPVQPSSPSNPKVEPADPGRRAEVPGPTPDATGRSFR